MTISYRRRDYNARTLRRLLDRVVVIPSWMIHLMMYAVPLRERTRKSCR